MDIRNTVTLKTGKEHSIQRRHPWIFSGAIQKIEGTPADGDWVRVISSEKKVLGYGHYQKGSITVRVLSFGAQEPDANFYNTKVDNAFQQRLSTNILGKQTNACRLIHGEGDGLSGLIIDLYDGVAVLQAHSYGMHADRSTIASALKAVIPGLDAVYYKAQASPVDVKSEYLLGSANVPYNIIEHGKRFAVDWQEGQKTGFFLDQRENRNLLSTYSSKRKVLNAFCYTGGFSVYALAGGATEVHSVDVSAKAIELTRANLRLNQFDAEQNMCVAEDTFDFMKGKQDQYDLIVLDPPAFAKHKDSKHQAMKGYKRLNSEAMRIIRRGGILFTFSCSQVVDRQLFYDTIVSAAIVAERNIKVLQHLGQPADHPVSIYHPEGEYLKGLVLYVE
jgi:23S rRNA (cytosine1962-C5)-methyltransferase